MTLPNVIQDVPIQQNFDALDAVASYIGEIRAWAGSQAPSDRWRLCQGQEVSRTEYSVLFGICGTNFGAGDGSTTFNLPDLRGRTMSGVGTHTDVDAIGKNEGSALGNRSPKHNHGSHSHGLAGKAVYYYAAGPNNTGSGAYQGSSYGPSTDQVGPSGTPLHGPAYMVINYIIRVK